MNIMQFETDSATATQMLGRHIATLLKPGDVVFLHGDLGAGKTTIVQGIAAELGAHGQTQSPTFSLVVDTPLPDGLILRHIDLYRLDDPNELETLGFEDLINDDRAITLIEWPERAVGMLPDAYLLIELEPSGHDRRSITVRSVGLTERFFDRSLD